VNYFLSKNVLKGLAVQQLEAVIDFQLQNPVLNGFFKIIAYILREQ